MRIKLMCASFLLMILIGCAPNKTLVNSSIQQAESLKITAEKSKSTSVKTTLADEKLLEAKSLNENGNTEEALLAAEESILQYRLILAQRIYDDLSKDYELLEKELQAALSYKNQLTSQLEQIRRGK